MSSRLTDKREVPRIEPFVVPCQLVQRVRRRAAYVTDLGARGARVSVDGPTPAVGASVTIELRIGRQAARSRLRGLVKWVRAREGGGHEFGLTWSGLKARERHALLTVIEEFRRRAAQIA